MINLSTMRLKPQGHHPTALIEARHGCESCGILITATVLETDVVSNDPAMKRKAMKAIKLLNSIAGQINKQL